MGVSELTNDPGARNNSKERVNGALHELDVSTTVQNDCFGCKGRQSRSKGAGSTTGAEGHTYMEHLRSGGRVQRHHLGGFDGVTYSPARASFSTQARADASFDITLTAGAIGCVRHPFTPPPPDYYRLYSANSSYANELQLLLASPSSPPKGQKYCTFEKLSRDGFVLWTVGDLKTLLGPPGGSEQLRLWRIGPAVVCGYGSGI